jgi:dTDP-4-dehydrorhamnose 3,5-epimerase
MIDDVIVSKLDIIETPGGGVLHAMKNSSGGFTGFGEAYFSEIDGGAIKAWKRHNNMILNIVVPVGKIKFVLFDDRYEPNGEFQEIIISRDNYIRLTVPPMIWFGFQGLDKHRSTLLNIANIVHDPNELERIEIDKINYDWSEDR